MRTSFTLLAATLFAASAMAVNVQPEARATPAPVNRAVRRADVIISGGSIICNGLCADGSKPDSRCNCGIGSSGSSFETTVLGSGLSSNGGSSSTADEDPASTENGEASSTDIFGPGGVFGTATSSSTSTSSSSSTSTTRTAAPTTTRDPNAAGAVSAPGFKAAAAGLALGVAAFVL